MKSARLTTVLTGPLLGLAVACGHSGSPSSAGTDAGGTDGSGEPWVRPPAEWAQAAFIDAHMHCGLSEAACSGQRCCDFSGFAGLAPAREGRAVLLSNEYWRVNDSLFEPQFQDYFEGLNDAYLATAATEPNAIAFVGLRCLYQEKLDDAWAAKCKAEAKNWVTQGALGFKDHIGKQFESGDVEAGYFLGGWNRFNGFCQVMPGSSTPNSDCMQQPTVRYLALEPAWREVLRYILEELRVPIVSHAASYDGAATTCYDPTTSQVAPCAQVTREHQLLLAEWLGSHVPPEARRRFIVAHMGFMTKDAAGLTRMLDTGVSTDTARFEAFAVAGCAGRALVAAYPKQLVFGTDRRVDQNCLPSSYDAFLHALQGPVGVSKSFTSCWGTSDTTGMQLADPKVPGCADVPPGVLDAVLKRNFLSLYP
ncbi:MAG: hypothetical protein R3B13_14370 [Polyangiaceae bacterium]